MFSLRLIHSGAFSATLGSRNPAGCWFICFFSLFFLSDRCWFFPLILSFLIFLMKQKGLFSSAFIRQCLHRPRPKSFSGAQGASQGASGHPPTRPTAYALREAPGQMQLGPQGCHVTVSRGRRTTGWRVRDHCRGFLGRLSQDGRTTVGRRARGSSLLTLPRKLIRWPNTSSEMSKH